MMMMMMMMQYTDLIRNGCNHSQRQRQAIVWIVDWYDVEKQRWKETEEDESYPSCRDRIAAPWTKTEAS